MKEKTAHNLATVTAAESDTLRRQYCAPKVVSVKFNVEVGFNGSLSTHNPSSHETNPWGYSPDGNATDTWDRQTTGSFFGGGSTATE